MDGFADAYSRYVTRVSGASGFVRATAPPAGKVSVVIGGGAGHYPSYAGLVGPGLADGCVVGELFASPSATQVTRIAHAAHHGGGIVLAFGNYAGDRLNFGVARQRLQAEGLDVRIIPVTDDIASAPAEEVDRRRGIAGTFLVYKVGGAAADRGDQLDEVERLMRASNAATFSFGVAFAGCTLPGHPKPLFSVENGEMELGLGIHGEPGIRSAEILPAPDLARSLVDAVLVERPRHAGPRAAVIVNGLGATKYEELFGLYAHIHGLLAAEGVDVILPEVGELVTSLDMAGCSLSVMWLDDELETCWSAPANTAAFHRHAPSGPSEQASEGTEIYARPAVDTPKPLPASQASAAAAAVAREMLAAMLSTVIEHEQELGRLDAVAGDGDHGHGMVRGLRAAVDAASRIDGGVGTLLDGAGAAFGDEAGGTSGILWGLILSTVGSELGDVNSVTAPRLCHAVRSAAEAVQRLGEAQPGDKTMLDALIPFVDALEAGTRAGMQFSEAWRSAADTSERAAAETAGWPARVGRARPLADRSIGTPDPGATSLALVARAALGPLLARTPDAERILPPRTKD